jgi:hypothetical protein
MKPFIINLDETYAKDLQNDSILAQSDAKYQDTLYKFIQWTIEVTLFSLPSSSSSSSLDRPLTPT